MAVVRIGDILLTKALINQNQIKIVLTQQKITGELFGDAIVKLGFVTSKELGHALAEQAGMEYVDLSQHPISEEALKLIPKEVAESAGFMPIDVTDGRLRIGITNPSNIIAIDKVVSLTKTQPKVYMVDPDNFRECLEKSYFFLENPILQNRDKIINEIKETGTAGGNEVTSLTDMIFMDGIRKNASDIHVSPASDSIHIFYRSDGVMHYEHGLPKIVHSGIVSRIKILSKLDIAETRLPQDGSFTYTFLNKNYDIRVSTIPTIYGENVVMRILAGTGALLRIDTLGFHEQSAREIKALFQKPYGVILVAGPTGSGKTTTLYAALREINLLERNVITIEDPVEYKLSMVRQSQVNEKTGYDFAFAARNFMRQDPDVMLIGEIRDEETAKIAIRTSITGHLVLATIHTNDALTSIPRLLDLKVDKFLLSSSLLAIIAQRLARKICSSCKTAHTPNDHEKRLFQEYGMTVEKIFRGQGCDRCNGIGYAGRVVIGEILIIDDEMRELIYADVPITAMHATAVKKGMIPLKQDGLIKVAQGITSLEELIRVAG
ncbi:MAG: Flp pilus assembly complex ATPase component TadA [Proteobacteria bacterium]|nr:Flp pilus assembly complex ATPase component TadA [Pseudomonadota bacterium]